MKICRESGFVLSGLGGAERRSFLLLQGVCSPFFFQLGQRLEAQGHQVLKLNFNVGDKAFWPGRNAVAFRGAEAGLPVFLEGLYARYGITDQVLFGDCRPVHRPAVAQGRGFGVRTHVFEEGYFRPNWVTLEREGVNAFSRMPRDPAWFVESARRLPEPVVRGVGASFRTRALHDVMYHAAGALNPLLYPGYRTHAPVNAAFQYLGYMRRLPMLRLHAKPDATLIEELIGRQTPYFLLPLQLDGDAQIRLHSQFGNMADVMAHVLRSFALHAPAESHLLIKNHPLDLGLAGHWRKAQALARAFGVEGRVHFVETGDLTRIVRHARGTVTVNSTVGSVALGEGCPTVCLADPIYNLPGLTARDGLDAFWREQVPPDAGLFADFRKTVIHAAQINGGFYCRGGIALAVENAIPRLLANRSPLEVLDTLPLAA